MEDIAPKLFEELIEDYKKELEKRTKKDKASDYLEAQNYSIKVNEAFKKTVNLNITDEVLPDGRLYFNIAERTIKPLLELSYEDVSKFVQETQQLINDKNKIGIKAIKPKINQDKVDETISYLANANKFNDVKDDLFSMSENLLLSAIDEGVRANAEVQYNRGLNPKIKRISMGNCCAWCQNLAGTYSYSEVSNTGNNVFRRHRYCRCLVLYDEIGKFKTATDVHTKKKIDYKEIVSKNKKSYEIVTKEYVGEATPKRGTIEYLKGSNKEKFKEEREVIEILHNKFGGDVSMNDLINNQSNPDYIWNDGMWELKTISSEKAVDSAIRKAIKQIDKNPGGIIVRYHENLDESKIIKNITDRVKRSNNNFICDVMIIKNDKISKILRYK